MSISSRVKSCINKIKGFDWRIAGLYWPVWTAEIS